jgi:hypothetical protein
VALGREPSGVPDQGDDLRGQDRPDTEDVSQGSARNLHFLADAGVEVGDPPVEARTSRKSSAANCRRTDSATDCESRRGRTLRRMRAALSAESLPGTPPGIRSRRSPWRLP